MYYSGFSYFIDGMVILSKHWHLLVEETRSPGKWGTDSTKTPPRGRENTPENNN